MSKEIICIGEKKEKTKAGTFLAVSLLFVFLFSFGFVSAQDLDGNRFYQDNGISLGVKEAGTLKVGQNYTYSVHLYNSTTGAPLAIGQAYCAFHLYDSETGSHILINSNISFGSTTYDYFITIDGASNFTKVGTYPYVVACIGNSNVESGVYSSSFNVTPDGFLNNLGYYFIILLLSFGTIFIGFYIEDHWVVMFGSLGLYFLGIYTLFFGINGMLDKVYTWGFSLIILGLAMYFSIRAGYEAFQD